MQTYARIAGGVVAELVTIDPEGPPIHELFHPDLVAAMVPVPDGQEIAEGWTWDDAEFDAPVVEAQATVVPASVSRRQLLLAMAGAQLITGEEALAAATTGAVPKAIDQVFSALPKDQALAARITWATMSVAEREHPLIAALIAAKMASDADVDRLFIAGAAL